MNRSIVLSLFSIAALSLQCLPANAGQVSSFALTARAQDEAGVGRPRAALQDYRDALRRSGSSPSQSRISHFGIAHMLVWLGDYKGALDEYRLLLQTPLEGEDRDIALAGAVTCLSFLDRSREAFQLVGNSERFHSAPLALAAARAAWWSDRVSFARQILDSNRDLLAHPQLGGLGPQLVTVSRGVRLLTQPSVKYAVQTASDSDGFSVNSTELTYGTGISTTGEATIGLRGDDLRSGSWGVHGRGAQFGYDQSISRNLHAGVSGTDLNYGGWEPFLWTGEMDYQSTDFFRIAAYAAKDTIETQPAFQSHALSSTVGISPTVWIASGVALRATGSSQRFSDGNRRFALAGSFSAPLIPRAGVGVILDTRNFTDSIPGSNLYFDPSRFNEQRASISFKHRYANWQFEAAAGIGTESILGTRASTSLVRLDVHGDLGGCLTADTGLTNSNFALSSPSGYRRFSAAISLSCSTGM